MSVCTRVTHARQPAQPISSGANLVYQLFSKLNESESEEAAHPADING